MTVEQSSHKVADSIETAPAKARNNAVGASSSSESGGIGAVSKGNAASVQALGPPQFSSLEEQRQYMKEHMAGAFRYMGAEGYGKEGSAGHISIRDPIMPDHFW